MSSGRPQPPVLLHVALPSMSVIEHGLAAGYDGVLIDLQHGEIGVDTACAMLRSIPRGNAWIYVRVASIDSGVIGRLLDSGASGIVAPTIESADEARALVAAVKYPPLGCRSLGPSRPALYSGADYCAAGNTAVAAVVQIETIAGQEVIDEILAVAGIDSIYVGPADLAVSYGLVGRADWQEGPVAEAMAQIARRAHEAGVRVGLYCSDARFATRETQRVALDYVGVGIDLLLLAKQAREAMAIMKELR